MAKKFDLTKAININPELMKNSPVAQGAATAKPSPEPKIIATQSTGPVAKKVTVPGITGEAIVNNMPKPVRRTGVSPYKKATPSFDFRSIAPKNKGKALAAESIKAPIRESFKEKQRKAAEDKVTATHRAELKEERARQNEQNRLEAFHKDNEYDGKTAVEAYLKNPALATDDSGTDFYNRYELMRSLDKSVPLYEVREALRTGESKRPIFTRQPELKTGNTDYIKKGLESGKGTLDKDSEGLKSATFSFVNDDIGYTKGRMISLEGDISLKPQEYMTNDEIAAYYSLLGRYGETAAESYLGALMPKLRKAAQNEYIYEEFKKQGEAHPVKSNLSVLGHSFGTMQEAFEDMVTGNDKEDYSDYWHGIAINAITDGQMQEADNWLGKMGTLVLNGLAQNFPEMLLAPTGLGWAVGGFQNLGVDRARMYLNGTLDSDGTIASQAFSFAVGAVPMGNIGKLGGKALVKTLGKQGIKTGLKAFVIGEAGAFISGAGAGLTTNAAQDLVDKIFMGDNSPYELSVRAYKESGMSEAEAREQATKDSIESYITSAIVGGIQGAIMSIPSSARQGVDFRLRGIDILDEDGGVQRVIDEAQAASKTSEAYINAERLKERARKGKEITDDMIGAQDYLNEIEARRAAAYMAGMTDITGIRFTFDDIDPNLNATHEKGVITLSKNPDTGLVEIVKHDTAHGVESVNKRDFRAYRKALRNAPGFAQAIDHLKKVYDDAGIKYNKKTLESEVAAEFARNFVKETKDLARLKRAVDNNPTLADRMYNAIRDLRIKLDIKGGKVFSDEVTGIKLSRRELLSLEKLYESMLINTHDKFFPDSSPMHSVKQENDGMKWGVSIHDELSAFTGKKMSRLWGENKRDVKELIRDAYRLYKAGKTKEGDNKLTEAGGLYAASLKHGGGKSDIDAFKNHFKKLYKEGSEYNKYVARRKENEQDKRLYNISARGYLKGMLKEIGAKGMKNNDAEATLIRDALHKMSEGDESTAKSIIESIAEDMYKSVERGLSDTDKALIKDIIGSRIKLDKNGEGGENIERLRKITGGTYDMTSSRRGADSLLSELRENYKGYPFADDTESLSPVDEILRVYDAVRNSAAQNRYSPQEIKEGARYMAEKFVKDYYDSRPKKDTTPSHIKENDISRYGADIGSGVRGLDIEGMRETDVERITDGMRRVIDKTLEGAKREIEKTDIYRESINEYDAALESMVSDLSKTLRERGYSADDTEAAIREAITTIGSVLDMKFSELELNYKDMLTNLLGKEDGKPQKPKAPGVEQKIKDRLKNTQAIRKKLSRTYTNTAQKDFFGEASDEVRKSVNDFVYDAVKNKDTARSAIDYISRVGINKVFRELATIGEGGVSAFDTAKAWALAAELRNRADKADTPEEKTRYNKMMVDVLSIMREKWTEAGQAIAAIKMFDMLSLEGQLLELRRKADGITEREMKKRTNYDQLKNKEREIKKRERAKRAQAEAETEKVPDKEAAKDEDKPAAKKRTKKKKAEKTPLSELERFYEKHNLPYISDERWEYMRQILTEIDEIETAKKALDAKKDNIRKKGKKNTKPKPSDNAQDIIDMIIALSKKRKTGSNKIVRALIEGYYNEMSKKSKSDDKTNAQGEAAAFNVLLNTARAQVFSMIDDALPKGIRQKISSFQSMAMLNNLHTFSRNVLSNLILTPGETVVNNLSALTDTAISLITKQRGAGFETPLTGINGGLSRARQAAIEQSLKVNTLIDSSNGYTDTKRRIFTSRFMSRLEELTGYNLTVTDEFQKGITKARIESSLMSLVEKGKLSPEEAAEIVAYEMKYRTFQDDTAAGTFLDNLKTALNKLTGSADFGLGDFIVKFTRTPGAVATRSIEYSPAGYVKFFYTLTKSLANAKKEGRKITAKEQRQISQTFWRPTTGLGLMWLGSQLRQLGILVGSDVEDSTEDREDDSRLKKFRQALGTGGFKINMSALARLIKGESTDAQNGDELLNIDWLTFMPSVSAGAAFYEKTGSDNKLAFREIIKTGIEDTADYTALQMSNLSAFEGIRDLVNNFEYKENWPDLIWQTATDAGLSFVPQLVKQIANVADDKQRDVYHADGSIETSLYKAAQAIPFASRLLPEKVNTLGEEQSGTLGSVWKDILNEAISPGRVDIYTKTAVTDELSELYDYDSGVMPRAPKTNNTVQIDGDTYKFSVTGEDFSEYSKTLGKKTIENISLFMGSDYYKYLPKNQRAKAISDIIGDTEKAVKTVWALKSLGRPDSEQTSALTAKDEEYKSLAEEMVYINQATEYIKNPDVLVENVVSATYKRDFTPDELQTEIAEKEKELRQAEKILQKKINGDGYIMIPVGTTKKKLKTANMTPEQKALVVKEQEAAVENAKKMLDKTKAGKTKVTVDIKGKWRELEDFEKEAVLDRINTYPEKTLIPDELMEPENIKKLSDNAAEDDSVIDLDDDKVREKAKLDFVAADSKGNTTQSEAKAEMVTSAGGGTVGGKTLKSGSYKAVSLIGVIRRIWRKFTGRAPFSFKAAFKKPENFSREKPKFVMPFNKA